MPGTVIETTRGCARLSPELISRRLASSVSSTDQARLWWNIKCCLVSHWQQRCHLETQEKSIRLSSVSQVLPVIRFERWVFAALNPNRFLVFLAGLFWSELEFSVFSFWTVTTCEHVFMTCGWGVRYRGMGIYKAWHPISTRLYLTHKHTHTPTHTHIHVSLFLFTFSLFQFGNFSGMSVYLSTDP